MRLGLGMRLSDILKGGAAPKSSLVDDLVSYWSLDEASGTRSDLVGDNDLTDNNTVGADTGKNGNAASFVTVNAEYLSKTDVTLPDSYTISMWLKADGVQQGAFGVFTCYNGWADDNQVVIFGGDTSLNARIGDGGSSTYKDASITEGSGWASLDWFNVIVTFDAATKVAAIYKNNSAGTPSDALAGTPYRTAAPLNIGRLAVTSNYWNGLIDEVAIWSRVLTEDERAELYAVGAGKFYNSTTEDFE